MLVGSCDMHLCYVELSLQHKFIIGSKVCTNKFQVVIMDTTQLCFEKDVEALFLSWLIPLTVLQIMFRRISC